MFTHLIEAFRHHVRTRPDEFALIVPRGEGESTWRFSWRQLDRMIGVVATYFSKRWLERPELPRKIGYASDNTLADVLIAFAAMSEHLVEVPIDHRLGDDEIRSRWERVDGYWLGKRERKTLLERACGGAADVPAGFSPGSSADLDVDVDELSLILWTSGTTGRPQGVKLSYRNLCGNAAAKLAAVPQRVDDVRLCVLPLCHAYARTCDFGTWLLSGCTLALGLGFDGWLQLAPDVRPTLANTVPSLADRLLDGDANELGLQRLRLLGCGGAAMSRSSFDAWTDRGVTVIQGYGLTEASPVICSATPEQARPGCVGDFVDGWEHRIDDDGRLRVRGPHVMQGYWDDDEASSQKVDADGWLDTNDLVEIDRSTGQLRILGRADDVIVLDSGRKLNPWLIEREIEQVEGVRHALLVQLNERLELWIDADERFDAARLASIDRWFPPWQRPDRVALFDPPLSRQLGELTSKGTKRRCRIAELRWGFKRGQDQNG